MYQFLTKVIVAAAVSQSVAVAPEHAASCAVENQPAAIVHTVAPEYPAIAKAEGLTGTSVIRVDLAADGSVVGASVFLSSGSPLLDQQAIRTVKEIGYAPETRECQAVSGSYKVEVEFGG